VIDNDSVEIGTHRLRAVNANFDLVDRPPNLETYVHGQMAVVTALVGRPVAAASTTDSNKKHARFLLLLGESCGWTIFSADVADIDQSFSTHRVDKILSCLRADPTATMKACNSAD
jgi:hypothetical protein